MADNTKNDPGLFSGDGPTGELGILYSVITKEVGGVTVSLDDTSDTNPGPCSLHGLGGCGQWGFVL